MFPGIMIHATAAPLNRVTALWHTHGKTMVGDYRSVMAENEEFPL
jgi:hypothetical protein